MSRPPDPFRTQFVGKFNMFLFSVIYLPTWGSGQLQPKVVHVVVWPRHGLLQ